MFQHQVGHAQWESCPGGTLETVRARMHPEVGQCSGRLGLLGNQLAENRLFIYPFWKISNLWLLCGLAALAGWRETCDWGKRGGGLSLPAALIFPFGENVWGSALGACRALRKLWLLSWIWGSEACQAGVDTKGPSVDVGQLLPSFKLCD